MEHELRAREIAEIKRLLNEIEAMSRHQIVKLQKIRSLLATIEQRSKQVKVVEDGGEGSRAAREDCRLALRSDRTGENTKDPSR